MGVSITTTSEPSKFDIFDNGLALLALHSACLALAFTAVDQAGELVQSFNLVLMIGGFACGAVLAVLAAYYGTINSQALGPQLVGDVQTSGPIADAIKVTPSPELVESDSLPRQADTVAGFRLSRTIFPIRPPLSPQQRSRWIVAGVTLILLVILALIVLPSAGKTTSSAEQLPKPLMVATKAEKARASEKPAPETAASPGGAVVDDKNKRTTSSVTKKEEEARNRIWRAWLIIGLAALVLLPNPVAWTGPSRFLSASRGFLVLGSLLSFVLGIGGALLPLAADAVEAGVQSATDSRVPPGAPGAPTSYSTPPPVNVTFTQTPSDSGGTPVVTTPPDTQAPVDLTGLEQKIAELRAGLDAALARPVQVRMDPPEIQIEAPSQTPQPLPPIELTVIGAQGEQGTPGTPGPVRDCKWDFQRFWPRTCTWVPAPTHLPAEAPRTSF
jgi:hypothetical protein